MYTLIIPVAGKSSRFPDVRPKWLLTMPNGDLMIEWSIEKLDYKKINRIVIICLSEHLEKYIRKDKLIDLMKRFHDKVEVIELAEPTKSQSETVYQGIIRGGVTGSILIKDCDNQFSIDYAGGNMVGVGDLHNAGKINAANKSYVEIDGIGEVKNIIEKSVVSNYFCAGAYGFESSKEFIDEYSSIEQEDEVYISHIIYSLLLKDYSFKASRVNDYIDIGTLDDYRDYTGQFKTIFCDLDGVLFINGSKFSENGWKTDVIMENINALKKIQDNGNLYLVVTTSRPISELDYISSSLEKLGLFPDKILTDLPHSKRYLVNDYSSTNSYPTAISVNLKRNIGRLSEMLND